MREKEWQDLTRREKDDRRKAAFKTGVRERVDAMVASGVPRDKAIRKASHDQETTSNRAWDTYEREDGQK